MYCNPGKAYGPNGGGGSEGLKDRISASGGAVYGGNSGEGGGGDGGGGDGVGGEGFGGGDEDDVVMPCRPPTLLDTASCNTILVSTGFVRNDSYAVTLHPLDRMRGIGEGGGAGGLGGGVGRSSNGEPSTYEYCSL